MSHQLRVIPDPFEFARVGGEIAGEIDAGSLSRFAGLLRADGGASSVQYRLNGAMRDGKAFLDFSISAQLMLTCQRCLGVLECPVEVENSLLLVKPEEALPDEELEDDGFDPVHAGRNFDVLEALEEELLLALPLAPTHSDCSVPVAEASGDDRSPFAALKNLRIQGASEK